MRLRVLPLLLLLGFTPAARAAGDNSSAAASFPTGAPVEVRVLDQSGAVIPDAEVLIQRSGDQPFKVGGSELGVYRSGTLPPGTYLVTVFKPGFAPITQEITLEAARPATLSITLRPQGLTESVQIEASPLAPPPVTSGTRLPIATLDLPQTVDVVSAELIRKQGALSVQDALANVPGLTPQLGEGRRDQVAIRGFSAVNDVYLDGVRDDAKYYRDLSNVEQVEVVKGPAGALFGRGSSGGLVNRVTKKPVFGAHLGEITAMAGSYDRRRVQGDFADGPEDAPVAFRVTGAFEDGDSYRPYSPMKRAALSPSAGFRPHAGSELIVQADFLYDDRIPDRGTPTWQGRPLAAARGFYYGYPADDFLHNRVAAQSATWQQALGTRWALRNVFRHAYYDNSFSNTFNGAVRDVAGTLFVSRSQYNVDASQRNLFNQLDLTTGFDTGRVSHALLMGIEVGREATDTIRFTGTADDVTVVDPVLTRPVYGTSPSNDNDFTGTTVGVYVQDQISFGSRWRSLVGVRYDYNDQTLDDRRPANVDLGRVDRDLSPRAGLVFKARESTSLYAMASRSFQPSGDGLSLAVNNAELEPEQTSTYEAGVKSEMLSHRLTVTAAVFRLTRFNVKTTDPLDPTRLVLVGKQRSNGIELTAAGSIVRHWDVTATVAVLDPQILRSNDVSSGVRVEGNRIGNVAARTASVWSTYLLPHGVTVGAGVFHLGDRFTSNDNLVRIDPYTRVDAVAGYRFGRYELQLNVRNLLDVDYYETAHSNNNVMPAAGRNGLISLRCRW